MKRTPAPSWLQKRRKPIGETKRRMVQWEAAECRTLERLFGIHRLDYWHCTVAQASQPGWPDYVVFGVGWHAFIEVKARNRETGRMGKVSEEQSRWRASIECGGGEWVKFGLPDDWPLVHDWLYSHTGIKTQETT